MITVAILINGNPLMARSAHNTGRKDPLTREDVYHVDDGSTLLHFPEEGTVKLAHKLLDTIAESED